MKRKVTIGERLVGALGGVTQSDLADVRKRAYEAGYNDGGEDEPASGDLARYGYKKAGRGSGRLAAKDPAEAVELAWNLWQSNPLAKRPMTIKRDYIIGRGVQITAADPDLQTILDAFWTDNNMNRRAREFALQLFLFGSQCYPAFVREADGRVRLGYIDPGEIERVVAHPDNAMEMCAVVLTNQDSVEDAWVTPRGRQVFRIIRKADGGELDGLLLTDGQAEIADWEIAMLAAFGLDAYSGSCFYEKVNSVSNQTGGYSDLLAPADWLDQHDETLFALADREQMAGYFSWDVQLSGADEDQVEERAKVIRARPPKKGSVNVHNDAEAWTFNYPELKQAASIETANALLTFILGGMGLPRHWYGYGDETNRATAAAQGDPTWRSLEHDQDIVKELLLSICTFVRDQAQMAGKWTPPADGSGEIDLTVPEMTSRDLATTASAASSLAMALVQAVDSGWIANDTAAEAWARIMAELGTEVDAAAEAAKIEGGAEDGGIIGETNALDWFVTHSILVGAEEEGAEV